MKSILAGVAVVVLAALGGAYYYFVWPPSVLKHKIEQALVAFNAAVATHDRARIGEALQTVLADQAHVKLTVSFVSPLKRDAPDAVQDFDKEQFLAFADNVLYALKTYSFDAKLCRFSLSAYGKTADVAFDSQSAADDFLYYGAIQADTHFNADIACTGLADFSAGNGVLDSTDCKVLLTVSAQQRQVK